MLIPFSAFLETQAKTQIRFDTNKLYWPDYKLNLFYFLKDHKANRYLRNTRA